MVFVLFLKSAAFVLTIPPLCGIICNNVNRMIEVFYIKKCIALIGIAALLLTGCGREDVPEIPSFSYRQQSTVISSDKGGALTSDPSDISDTSSGESVPQPNAPQTLVLSNDPINEKFVELNGNTLTITGRTADSLLKTVSVFPDCVSIDCRLTTNGFTVTAEVTDPTSDGVCITLRYEDGNSYNVNFAINEDGFAFYDLSDIIGANKNAVEKALEQPLNQVAEYIVEGGDVKEMREVMDEIQKLSDEICGGLSSDHDKLRAISRWVSANIYYDYPAYDAGIPAETLSLRYLLDNHSSVCGGYSNMTSALCAAQGIKCWNVHGSVLLGDQSFALDNDGGVYHEWNFAEIDGRIVWLDAGWDSFCKLQRNGEYENGGIGYRYFDIGEEYFAENHKANYAEYRDYFALLQ